jgi:hypothetical protein
LWGFSFIGAWQKREGTLNTAKSLAFAPFELDRRPIEMLFDISEK